MTKSYLDTLVGDYVGRFPESGTFLLRRGESIRGSARRSGVPNKYGAYIILSPLGEVLYIGNVKAGRILLHFGRLKSPPPLAS